MPQIYEIRVEKLGIEMRLLGMGYHAQVYAGLLKFARFSRYGCTAKRAAQHARRRLQDIEAPNIVLVEKVEL